jgi:hypothetical protein
MLKSSLCHTPTTKAFGKTKMTNHQHKPSKFPLSFITTLDLRVITHILLVSVFYQPDVYAGDISVRPQNVLSVVTADWNSDGSFDRAILIESETEPDQSNLLIYLSESSGIMKLAIHKKDIAWRGALWGTQPTLETNEAQSLAVISANDAIGRHRWHQKLTVAYRNKTFVVAGYTYSERDTLAPDNESSCDVNFLAGKIIKNNKTLKISIHPITLADWSETSVPKDCQ